MSNNVIAFPVPEPPSHEYEAEVKLAAANIVADMLQPINDSIARAEAHQAQLHERIAALEAKDLGGSV